MKWNKRKILQFHRLSPQAKTTTIQPTPKDFRLPPLMAAQNTSPLGVAEQVRFLLIFIKRIHFSLFSSVRIFSVKKIFQGTHLSSFISNLWVLMGSRFFPIFQGTSIPPLFNPIMVK